MKNHILKTIKPNDQDSCAADAIDKCYHWIINDFAPYNCRLPSGTNQQETKCRCARFLLKAENIWKAMYLPKYLVHYAKMKHNMKRELMFERVEVASVLQLVNKNNKTLYMVPRIPTEEDEPHLIICCNDLQRLLN
eukprot:11461648-Ditylum_brightwellii.AAC.1